MIWVQAPNIEGHEVIVEKFKASTMIENLPEQYVITTDLYRANYKRHTQTPSEISRTMPYVPRRGTLTEASELGRKEPDIFYKLLAKKNWDGRTKGNVYSTPCDLLFVRTNKKQIYKKVHRVRMFVEKQYHDSIHRICKAKEETKAQANARLVVMQDKTAMKTEFVFMKPNVKPKRIGIAQYEARKRREDRIKMATPKWCNVSEIKQLHSDVYRLNKKAGSISYHLDHIVPLHAVDDEGNHIACGLHTPENMQIIAARDNLIKSNKMRFAA